MEKICSRCNRKLGFFEKMYEDNLCKECYKIIEKEKAEELERKKEEEQRKKEEEQRKKEEEQRIKEEEQRIKEEEQRKKIATILLEQQKEEERKQKEKLDAAKNFLLYTNYYWVVIGNISLIPFHYEDIFNKSITNKFEIIKLLFDEIIKELPKDYSFNDIKRNYSI